MAPVNVLDAKIPGVAIEDSPRRTDKYSVIYQNTSRVHTKARSPD